jgi:hypothetical protein
LIKEIIEIFECEETGTSFPINYCDYSITSLQDILSDNINKVFLQSVSIATNVAGMKPAHGELYSIQELPEYLQ